MQKVNKQKGHQEISWIGKFSLGEKVNKIPGKSLKRKPEIWLPLPDVLIRQCLDLMLFLMKGTWRKQQPTVHAICSLVHMSDPRKRSRFCIEVEDRIKAPQTLCAPVWKWINRLRVARSRKPVFSGVEPQYIGTHPFGDLLNSKLHSTHMWRATVNGGSTRRTESH